MTPDELDILLERHADDSLSAEEKQRLADALTEHEWVQDRYIDRMALGAELYQQLADQPVSVALPSTSTSRSLPWTTALITAFSTLAIAWLALYFTRSKPIATLVSSEHASWESSLPTAPDSQLTPGFLKLKSGVATILFRSGAELKLEAPAHIILETPMRAKLLAGAVVVDVPEPAIGFTIETPGGKAIDLGTEFAVAVDPRSQESFFEVLSGEIEVHHDADAEMKRLVEDEGIILKKSGLEPIQARKEMGKIIASPGEDTVLRIGTAGKELSVISGDAREYLHPDMLMVKNSLLRDYGRVSIFTIDLSSIGQSDIGSAALRLNLIPSGLGLASLLPETNRFSIYHVPDAEQLHFDQGNETFLTWTEVDSLDKGTHLGSFTISRGQQRGSFTIQSETLDRLVREYRGSEIAFLLTRDTQETRGSGLVHAFAASTHPTVSGPTLELQMLDD